jgi:hypothetical protein
MQDEAIYLEASSSYLFASHCYAYCHLLLAFDFTQPAPVLQGCYSVLILCFIAGFTCFINATGASNLSADVVMETIKWQRYVFHQKRGFLRE